MTKTEGRVYTEVAEMLQAKGLGTDTLEVATLGRGPDHLIILNGETFGEYNHTSKKLVLYKDLGL